MEAIAILMRGLSRELGELLTQPSPRIAQIFEHPAAAYLAKILVIVEAIDLRVFENLTALVLRLISTAVLNDPQQVATAQRFSREIGQQVTVSQNVITFTFWLCVLVTALCLGV